MFHKGFEVIFVLFCFVLFLSPGKEKMTSLIFILEIPLQSWSVLWHGLYCLSPWCPDTYWINGSSYRLQFVVNVKPDFAPSWSWLFQGWWLFWRVVLFSCPFTHNHIYFHFCRSLYKPDISCAGFELLSTMESSSLQIILVKTLMDLVGTVMKYFIHFH